MPMVFAGNSGSAGVSAAHPPIEMLASVKARIRILSRTRIRSLRHEDDQLVTSLRTLLRRFLPEGARSALPAGQPSAEQTRRDADQANERAVGGREEEPRYTATRREPEAHLSYA